MIVTCYCVDIGSYHFGIISLCVMKVDSIVFDIVSSIGLCLPLSSIPSHTAVVYASYAWWCLVIDFGYFHPTEVARHVIIQSIVTILEHLFFIGNTCLARKYCQTLVINSLSICVNNYISKKNRIKKFKKINILNKKKNMPVTSGIILISKNRKMKQVYDFQNSCNIRVPSYRHNFGLVLCHTDETF